MGFQKLRHLLPWLPHSCQMLVLDRAIYWRLRWSSTGSLDYCDSSTVVSWIIWFGRDGTQGRQLRALDSGMPRGNLWDNGWRFCFPNGSPGYPRSEGACREKYQFSTAQGSSFHLWTGTTISATWSSSADLRSFASFWRLKRCRWTGIVDSSVLLAPKDSYIDVRTRTYSINCHCWLTVFVSGSRTAGRKLYGIAESDANSKDNIRHQRYLPCNWQMNWSN